MCLCTDALFGCLYHHTFTNHAGSRFFAYLFQLLALGASIPPKTSMFTTLDSSECFPVLNLLGWSLCAAGLFTRNPRTTIELLALSFGTPMPMPLQQSLLYRPSQIKVVKRLSGLMFTARRRSCTLHYSHKAAICQQSPIIHLMTKPTKLDTIHGEASTVILQLALQQASITYHTLLYCSPNQPGNHFYATINLNSHQHRILLLYITFAPLNLHFNQH
ncbi:division protein 1 [Fusarium oxysporum f. sp. albedinis]|nr:division protein 1 [Fusarium oxysporum f. sp. albedinis]